MFFFANRHLLFNSKRVSLWPPREICLDRCKKFVEDRIPKGPKWLKNLLRRCFGVVKTPPKKVFWAGFKGSF